MSREREIFDVAVDIDGVEARKAFVDKSCGDDATLRKRVNDLLDFDQEDQSFLSEEQLSPRNLPIRSLVGTKIGRYKLLEEIGEGGCGIVYMAEQSDPVRRKVALKIVKPGMDTREVIARFEAERQALAMMEHPNIARVFDVGESEEGRPFFVMELVDGVPITEFCDANAMTLRCRLMLFIKVCHAVQHAHQKGIIHRDIKPSNVLVTLHDGEAVPRVIDFGIAKALGNELTDKTLFTRFDQIVGTPQYMSPEQAERSRLDVDTRSDIYSLGVLLYELLTGQTPLNKARLKESAWDEVLRVVREEEPLTPSTQISTLGSHGVIIGEHRSTELVRLGRMLRGDLDWIVMRALEKERQRRFENVGDFINDIERHLANEPVVSGPPSAAYRATKFIRRNRLSVITLTAVFGSMLVGLALALMGLTRANAERRNAIESATESQTILTMLRHMLETNPDVGRGRDFTVRQMLDQFSESLRRLEHQTTNSGDGHRIWTHRFKRPEVDVFRAAFPNLTSQPAVAAEIHNILGNSYRRLDLYDDALSHFYREYELCVETYGRKHVRVAWAAHLISHLSQVKRDHAAVRKYGEIMLSTFDELKNYQQVSMFPRSSYCDYLAKTDQAERAERIVRRTLRELKGRWDELPDPEGASLTLKTTLSTCLAKQGKHSESLPLAKTVLSEALRYWDAGNDSFRSGAYIHYGECLDNAGKISEALAQYEQAVKLVDHLDATNIKYTSAVNRLAGTYTKLFRYDEAINWLEKLGAAEIPMNRISVFQQQVLIELNQGKFGAADRRCENMFNLENQSSDGTFARTAARFLLAISKLRRNPQQCESMCDDLLTDARIFAEKHPETFSLLYSWVLLHKSNRTAANVREAISFAKTAIEAFNDDYLIALAHHTLAKAYSATNRSSPDAKTVSLAVHHQRIAVDLMPMHQLFLKSEVEQQMIEVLEAADQTFEIRHFLEHALRLRVAEVPAKNIYLADARMRLCSYLINDGDFEVAEEMLEAHRKDIESRESVDIFRKRWTDLMTTIRHNRRTLDEAE